MENRSVVPPISRDDPSLELVQFPTRQMRWRPRRHPVARVMNRVHYRRLVLSCSNASPCTVCFISSVRPLFPLFPPSCA
ncbi:unnamed protein product, partial [Closterium sp. Naga37s-1]